MANQIKKQHNVFANTDSDFRNNLLKRHRTATIWYYILQTSTIVGIVVLMALSINIIDGAFGYVAIQNHVDPDSLAVDSISVENLPKETLVSTLENHISKGLFRRFDSEVPFSERSQEDVYKLVYERVIEPEIIKTWRLFDSLFKREEIYAEVTNNLSWC